MSESIVQEDLFQKVRDYVQVFFRDEVSQDYVYHTFEHTVKVVEASKIIGAESNLNDEQMMVVQLAAWFHDTGFHKGQENHEKESMAVMRAFLEKENVEEALLKRIEGCIAATKMPQNPTTLEEKVMADADLYHMSSDMYFSEWELMKSEHELISKEKIKDMKWLAANINFFQDHEYFTDFGKEELQKRKEKNFSTIKRRMKRIKKKNKRIAELEQQLEKMTKKASTDLKPDKARETMLRITSRNHLELSTMADSKANIMISINAIILSIVVSVLIRKLEESPYLIIPTIILTVVCSLTIIFAVLSTRPNVSAGKFSEKDVMNKKTNLLFFGNFHGMTLNEYMWGMKSMLQDPDYLYSSMIKDIYSLGVILGKKYKRLRTAYTIFMFGFVFAVISFVLAYYFREI